MDTLARKVLDLLVEVRRLEALAKLSEPDRQRILSKQD